MGVIGGGLQWAARAAARSNGEGLKSGFCPLQHRVLRCPPCIPSNCIAPTEPRPEGIRCPTLLIVTLVVSACSFAHLCSAASAPFVLTTPLPQVLHYAPHPTLRFPSGPLPLFCSPLSPLPTLTLPTPAYLHPVQAFQQYLVFKASAAASSAACATDSGRGAPKGCGQEGRRHTGSGEGRKRLSRC